MQHYYIHIPMFLGAFRLLTLFSLPKFYISIKEIDITGKENCKNVKFCEGKIILNSTLFLEVIMQLIRHSYLSILIFQFII